MLTRYFAVLLVCVVSITAHAQDNGLFLPPDGQTLLIVGQDLGAIGGLDDYNEGYTDTVGVIPAGLTSYTGITDLGGLKSLDNWGAGDVSAQLLMDEPQYENSVLAIGLWLGGSNLSAIASGSYDNNIETLGNWIAEQDRPVFLRIGYEFDGPWNAYDPNDFVIVWKRIVDTFEELEVPNYVTVWQSATAENHLTYKGTDWLAWYPGDDYVDWFGISYFEHSHNVFDDFLDLAREHDKPVMIAESTPRGLLLDKQDGAFIWDDWFAPYFQYIHDNRDVIRAVAYINVDWDAQSMWANQGWGDTRVQVNDVVLERWLAEIKTDAWLHSSDDLFMQLGYETPD